MVARVIPVDCFDLVIFGATGDLARRKILPGLYRRWKEGQIPEGCTIVGAARSDLEADGFRELVRAALEEFLPQPEVQPETVASFLDMLAYVTIDARGDAGWPELAALMRTGKVHAFYFSVAPALFGDIAKRLKERGIADRESRIVVEKPFGKDLATARKLNESLASYFHEDQIYRIDHYLGKETVQNLMAVRFANILFEPLWNAQYIDHVQITVAETVGVGGRGEYYDTSGAIRDMVQNHMMQLLCLIAMEPPNCFEPDAMRDEKLKVIRALDPVAPAEIVRGQYRGKDGDDYLSESGNPDSRTESFVAMKLHVSNWRWKGTPFYLRTGKRLRARASEIAVTFKEPPHSIFGESNQWRENMLVIRLQPDEGMDLRVMIKEPGPGGMRLKDVALDMSFAEALGDDLDIPDAYERLIMDVIRGNQTLFMRGDEVEAAWAWVDPAIDMMEQRGDVPEPYEPASAGPEGSMMLMHRDGRRWREMR
ncbi:Glucose-6-phosphate 1-dehydrogenase [Roseibaca ekhonensis]|uniref:Glucose-6-phosphate 1-dehydrogenase n=1 Tax=Roseinatronobacter ekhonensis TaxID=254356 RepID=A0A3B0MXS7_9RHOB|nr:glucose-6-phosphate dehydrogenase [Roseibaca ekhonensis]SUZ33534.1 Glucose-6-phosphate 1-dehydrogenase [Roseibaca ekhonensis]